MREAIRKERRVELAFEGLRYYDVLRWEIAEKELNHTFTGVKLSDDPNARNYRGAELLLLLLMRICIISLRSVHGHLTIAISQYHRMI